jgi:hypothetical protein
MLPTANASKLDDVINVLLFLNVLVNKKKICNGVNSV